MAATPGAAIAPRAVLSPEIDHSTGLAADPSLYLVNIITPTSGSTTPLIAGGETVISLEIPEGVTFDRYNSLIKGTYTLPSLNAGAAQFCAWVPPFSRIAVTSSSGTRLVDIPFAQQYFRLLRLRGVSVKEFRTRQLYDIGSPCRVAADDPQAVTPIPSAIPDVKSAIQPADVLVSASTLETMDAPLQLRSVPAGGAPLAIPFSLKLGELMPDSLFGERPDFIAPERLTITFTIANQDAFTWAATSQADAYVGAAVHTSKTASLTGFQIALLQQTNPRKVLMAQSLMKPGYMLAYPSLIATTATITPGQTSLGLNIPISGLGATEMRSITWAIGGATGAPWRVWDFSNVDSGGYQRITSYRTAINSIYMQTNLLNCTSATGGSGPYTDYEYNRDGESVMTSSRLTYQQCWYHRDDFQSLRHTGDSYGVDKVAIMGGYPLKGPSAPAGSAIYRIEGTMSGTFPVAVPESLLITVFAVATSTIRWGLGRLESLA